MKKEDNSIEEVMYSADDFLDLLLDYDLNVSLKGLVGVAPIEILHLLVESSDSKNK